MMSTQSEEFLETLERTHVVLFHDGNDESKKTEYGFMKKGLEKESTASIPHKSLKRSWKRWQHMELKMEQIMNYYT